MKKEEKESKTPNNGFFKNMKLTYKYIKTGKKFLILFALINFAFAILSVIFPVLTAKRLIALTDGAWTRLFKILVIIFVLEFVNDLFRLLSNYCYNKFYYNIRKNLQLNLVSETLKITQTDLNANSSGVFIERINNDTDNITDIFIQLLDYIMSIIGNIGILIAVYFINVWIGLAYTLCMVIMYVIYKIESNINYKNRKEWKKSKEKTSGFISEIVRGAKDIKILDAEKSFLNKADEYIKETNAISYNYSWVRSKLSFYGRIVKDLGKFSVFGLLCCFAMKSIITIENALIIANYNNQLIYTSDWIDQIFNIVKQYNLAANRIFGILEANEFEKEKFGNKTLKNFNGNIEFKNVDFSYEDNIPVLKGLNLKINANETVGFVGPSGAGKSTIFNLLSALNKPVNGTITFDGIDINELDKTSIRGNLSVISQNAYIFNMSIMDNLKVVKMNSTEKAIKEACKLACLDEFIESLPNKYDTIVGEGGVTLSGGQKQRLAIARALLLKTEILLFDEATSALDNETQTKIQEAISNLKGEYTILIIAHRLSTVIDANKIFVIDDGKVVGEGTHEYLLSHSEHYKKLYKKELEEKSK